MTRLLLEVIEPGLLSSVQDFGRPDAASLGVPAGGACDRWSLAVANALAGNPADAVALEMTMAGPSLLVREDCLVGLAGADLGAGVLGPGGAAETHPLLPGRSRLLKAGQRLVFATAGERQGIRAYLALNTGLDVPFVLGSGSACLVGGFPGLAGRAVSAGDVLTPAKPEAATQVAPVERSWPGDFRPAREATRRALRVVRGPHLDRLPGTAFDRLLSSEYRVSPRGDRQGIALDGPRLSTGSGAPADRMLSQGVVWGALQLPPDGRPICLLADHQTVGGYPVLAVVISADLPLLGQLGPTDPVTFREVSLDAARSALGAQDAEWRSSLSALAGA